MATPRVKTAAKAVTVMEATPVASLTNQERFGDALSSAIDNAVKFLEMEIRPDDPAFLRKWSIKASIIATVLNTGVKIDENELKRVRKDGYEELMQRVEGALEARRRLAAPSAIPKG